MNSITESIPNEQPILRVLNPKVVFTPNLLEGIKEIIIINERVVALNEQIQSNYPEYLTKTIDLKGEYYVTPGIVDIHCHVTGGGGESGFNSRVPRAKLSDMVNAGITSFVGVLGTDTLSRTPEDLLATVRGLSKDGLSGFMWIGGYTMPSPTICGSVKKDIINIPEIIGVGEVAVSDHRSSNPSKVELNQLAAEARVGGMCAEKSGVVYFHMGDHHMGLQPLRNILNETAIPVKNLLPTHMDRTEQLIREGKEWIRDLNGRIDFAGTKESVVNAIEKYCNFFEQEGFNYFTNISMSSDCYGSLPVFDKDGNLVHYDYGRPSVLLDVIEEVMTKQIQENRKRIDLTTLLEMVTVNSADGCLLKGKGKVAVGSHADILAFKPTVQGNIIPSTSSLSYVISKGKVLKSPGYIKKDMFGE